ncbi:hypothetical protein GP486_006021 [Trichoglossum hirsutum]|uniref:Acid phosphatase n=1 Tax=Trichoglossum hirsutum TaxID=265104 RepID=A0A9P8RL76_9PEZI|nr:hypothetical protein GP486_006021 [Trichoglossum hirsutum]
MSCKTLPTIAIFVAILSAVVHSRPQESVATQFTATASASVAAAAATAKTSSPTSHVKGKVFDRFVVIWDENTNSQDALNDPSFQSITAQSLLLTNFFAVTHPSEPNYIASFGGDYFGMNNDAFWRIPKNVSTLADLLDDKGISWSLYQEDMPYSGFEGFQWAGGPNGLYVRKHNPAVIYDSIAESADRLSRIKNLTVFYDELKNNKLPQWMFITPNMLHDGHDTNTSYTGNWTKTFLQTLLEDKNFNDNTLVLVTFDESEDYPIPNKVYAALLGDALPKYLAGTKDDTFYTHYSTLATVEANWDLHTLGRWDTGANVFSPVAAKTGDTLRVPRFPPLNETYLNESYPGPLNFSAPVWKPWPVPDMRDRPCGRTVLPSIRDIWGKLQKCTVYHAGVEVPSKANPPVYPPGCS